MPLPPFSEQQKIAEILSTVDEAIQKTDEVIAKSERLKKGLMQELLTKGIGHKEFKDTEIGRIPKDWEVVRIKDLGEVITGTTPSTLIKDYWDGIYPFVTPTDFSETKYVYKTERKVTTKGVGKGRLIPKDSVLVVCIGSTIGKISLAFEECITNQQINAIICKDRINPHYVYYAIASRKNMLRAQAGITAKPIINKSLFEKLRLPLPSTLEQKRIADILSTVDKKLETERNEKARLERIKQGLMDLLLTGKIRVKVV
jgi:type I restriction enzyme S subunit